MTDVHRVLASRTPSWRLNCVLLVLACVSSSAFGEDAYFGKHLGKLTELHHGVSGDVYAVDARTLHIRDFTYDGEGPAAYFYVGSSKTPSGDGTRINDEKGSSNVLPRYRKKHITLTLPEGKTLTNIKWFSVWCDEFSVNFGDVRIPKGFSFPKPQKLDALKGIHGVSSENVVIVDAQTLLVPSFSYDGEAPDAKFWVGPGPKPNPQGIRIPDENGKKEHPLRRYDQKTIVLTLPGDMTVFDIGHFGVWCEAFAVDFAHIKIPKTINVPPSLKMLGVSPQSKLNCEVLWDDLAFEVRWAVAGDSIVLQLVSKLEDREYMSFGLSGVEEKSRMIGGDVVVAWVDKETLKGYTDDYFLDAKSQCSGNRGSCPDKHLREGTSSVRLLNAAMVNGYSIVTYQRPLRAQDELDKPVFTNGSQAVIWAIGPLNSKNEVSYHSLANRNNLMLDFGRSPKWNCPLPESSKPEETEEPISSMTSSLPSKAKVEKLDSDKKTTILSSNQEPSPATAASVQRRPPATPAPVSKRNAWEIPPIQCNEPEDGVFYAQMGPTGGKRGYPAITGHVGWGISWYINGLLIPEINVVRGKTYTFVVEGGLDPEVPARYHPFYITDDPVGGYEHKTPEERAEVRVFAGVKQNRRGEVYPSGKGRLCNWTPDQNQPLADEFASFGAYQRTLTLECDQGEPGVVQWTPDDNTPDTVYYQCYTHRYLGWKINVLDSCDVPDAAASDQVLTIAEPDDDQDAAAEEDADELQSRPSIQVNYRVKPNDVYNKGVDESKGDKEYSAKPRPKFPENHQPEYSTYVFSHPSEPAGEDTYQKEKVVNAQQYNYHHQETHEDAFVPPPALQKENFNPQYSLQHQEYINETKSEEIKQKHEVKDIKLQTYEPTQEVIFEAKPDQKPSYPGKNSPYHLPMRTHYPMSMLNHARLPIGVHPMAFTRGPQFTSYRRPIPMNSYPPRPPMYRPSYAPQSHQKLMMSTKKPIYRIPAQVPQMSQHRPMVIPFHRPVVYQQNPHFTTRMPQRIIPLQHTAPSKVYNKIEQLPKAEKPVVAAVTKVEKKESSAMQPSTLISTNRPLTKKHTSYEAAVNTGFKPETVIVEGGFKPIVTVSKDVAQDRSSQVDVEMEYGEQEVKADEPERPQASYNEDLVSDVSARDPNPFENLQHEMFEPMFIPSPPDRMSAKNKAKLSISDDLTPPERAKMHNRKSSHMTRVRPGLVRRPFYPDNIVPPFRIPTRGGSASFRQASDDTEDEQAMAAERQETFYLPPAEYIESDGVVTYDGKSVSDVAVPAVGVNHQLAQNSEDLVRGTPQFGPFRGEGPPPIPSDIRPETIPQLNYNNRQQTPELPAQFNQGQDFPDPPPIRSTHLTLVSQLEGDQNGAELLPEASELKDTLTDQPAEKDTTLEAEETTNPLPVTEDKTTATVVETEEKVRNKREADHEPGHVGPHDHDHDHDHHDHHDHHASSGGGKVAAISILAAVLNLAVVMFL